MRSIIAELSLGRKADARRAAARRGAMRRGAA